MGGTRVVLVVDNKAADGLIAEHGFAAWIEAGGRRILFDAGQGPALEHNSRALGIDVGSCQVLVLSHGHYDHTGGAPRSAEDPQFRAPALAARAAQPWRDR
jgi:7,8-dihydropterin-6-yl-methyl-4-(beta-D-ribofuranosyl)aminobenzene 5'-phosphate synthase